MGLLVIELLINLTIDKSNIPDFKRSLIFLALRFILIIVPFICFDKLMTDIIFANTAIGIVIFLTYVEQFKLYNGLLIGNILNYVCVEK